MGDAMPTSSRVKVFWVMPCCWGSIVAPQAYVMLNMVTPDRSYVLDPPGPAETVSAGLRALDSIRHTW